MVQDRSRDGGRLLDVDEVGRLRDDDEPCAVDPGRDPIRVLDWRGPVVGADQDEGSGPRSRPGRRSGPCSRWPGSSPHSRPPSTTRSSLASDPPPPGARQHTRGVNHTPTTRSATAPIPRRGRSWRAPPTSRGDRGGPTSRTGRAGRSGPNGGQRPTSRPSRRATGHTRRPLDLEVVEQGEKVAAEVGDRVRPVGRRRAAVAAQVVAHDPKRAGEVGHLWLPHREACCLIELANTTMGPSLGPLTSRCTRTGLMRPIPAARRAPPAPGPRQSVDAPQVRVRVAQHGDGGWFQPTRDDRRRPARRPALVPWRPPVSSALADLVRRVARPLSPGPSAKRHALGERSRPPDASTFARIRPHHP